MDDWSSKFEAEAHELVGDGGGDEIGVGSFAIKNNAEADHGSRFFVGEKEFSGERNFEGSGNADEVDACVGKDFGELIDRRFDKRVGVLRVELAGDDRKTMPVAREGSRLWRHVYTHGQPVWKVPRFLSMSGFAGGLIRLVVRLGGGAF